MENNNNSNKFFTGFLWGAIIGGGVVWLLSTKKGKKLLNTISDRGLENISKLIEESEQSEGDGELFADRTKESNGESKPSVTLSEDEKKSREAGSGSARPLVRRFFRGIHKKING